MVLPRFLDTPTKQRKMTKQDDNVKEIIFSCTTELIKVSQGSSIHSGSR